MRIEVINTGTELLLGKVINSHVAFFGQELFKLGLRLQKQVTVPDGQAIQDALEESFPASDAILITGGLGPTNDDLTREIVAGMLGLELKLNQDVLDHIEEIFRSRGLQQNTSNNRQAMVPEGAEVLHNPNGTAPGLYVPAIGESPHLFLLPGPPRELHPMFRDQVIPKLQTLHQTASEVVWKNFRIYGVGESSIASRLEPELESISDLELGYCARLGEVDLRLIGSEASVNQGAEVVRSAYSREIVTESEDSIESVLVSLLKEKGQTVATAESCTGGLIASTITDASGSSAVFETGYVTYANETKTELLGVSPELLEAHGAVSEPVVRAMAEGALESSGADHALAVSGIAGPTGGTEEKPVGTVFVAVAGKNLPTFAKRYFHPSDRASFKQRTVRLVLDLLRQRLQGFELDS